MTSKYDSSTDSDGTDNGEDEVPTPSTSSWPITSGRSPNPRQGNTRPNTSRNGFNAENRSRIFRNGSNMERGSNNRRSNREQRADNEAPNVEGGDVEGMRMALVRMPTGKKIEITVPNPQKCNCTQTAKTTLKRLRPDGQMGAREFKIVSDQMNATIKKHGGMQFTKYSIVKIYKVINCCLYNRYRNMQREIGKQNRHVVERMLFHGSPSYGEILKRGFDERHSTIDGMFGAGIYFAEHSSKSNQYVFSAVKNANPISLLFGTGVGGCKAHNDRNCFLCDRKMLLCRVSLGKVDIHTTAEKLPHPKPGFHSVKGKPSPGGLHYPEYVIYRGEQAYPEYSISYRIVK